LDQEDVMTEFASQRPLLQEQNLLIELNHRVNNELATAISIELMSLMCPSEAI
jgi:two-component sensor histidine kinase